MALLQIFDYLASVNVGNKEDLNLAKKQPEKSLLKFLSKEIFFHYIRQL